MEIINLTYKSTNCYLIKFGSGWIMIDAGWPDTLHNMFQLLKQNSININDVKYLIVTHFHPDHGGLAQDFKDLGVKLILHESQVSYVGKLNEFFKRNPKANFKNIPSPWEFIYSVEKFIRRLMDSFNHIHEPLSYLHFMCAYSKMDSHFAHTFQNFRANIEAPLISML